MDFISHNESETNILANQISLQVKGGDILLLSGELGSGKTTFTKAFASAIGVKEVVTSPTFVILKRYHLSEAKNDISELIHTDCYRLSSPDDAYSIGLDEYFARTDVVTLIEWPEKIESIIPAHAKKISFEYVDENTRKISYNF